MGHIELNGIQTPPPKIWFEDRGPGTIISNWTYQGIFGAPTALPEFTCPLFTPPCEPRFVTWAGAQFINLPDGQHTLVVIIFKTFRSIATFDMWDSYWIAISIDGLFADALIEHRVTSETDYTRYQNNTPGLPWLWSFEGTPFQAISWTEAWPLAWDLTTPAPPFVPGL